MFRMLEYFNSLGYSKVAPLPMGIYGPQRALTNRCAYGLDEGHKHNPSTATATTTAFVCDGPLHMKVTAAGVTSVPVCIRRARFWRPPSALSSRTRSGRLGWLPPVTQNPQ
jgi:hypothetical protein